MLFRQNYSNEKNKLKVKKLHSVYLSSFFRRLSDAGDAVRLVADRLSRRGLYEGLTSPVLGLSLDLRDVTGRSGDLTDVLGLSELLAPRLGLLVVASRTTESKTLYRKSYLC